MKGMRNLLGLAVALCPFNAWALDFDWSPDTTRYLSDPAFLPLKGQIETHTVLEYGNHNGERSGSATEHEFVKSDGITETISYGITDRLTVRGSAGWSEADSKYNFYTYQFHSYDKGYSNPTFSVIYRFVDQGHIPISIDGQAFYTAEAANSTGNVIGGEIHLSRTMKSATIQGVVGLAHHGSGDYGSGTHDSYTDYYFTANGQLRLTSKFAVNSGISIKQVSDTTYYFPSGATYTDEIDASVSPYIGAEYGIIPGKIVAGLTYTHIFYGDIHRNGTIDSLNTLSGFQSINDLWSSRSSDIYSAHLRWLF